MNEKKRAVFLDRDGTINVEKNYLYRCEDFNFLPGVPLALKRLQDAGYLLVVVTNQSGVARGYYGLEDVDVLHEHMRQLLLDFGVILSGIHVCPHHPEGLPGNLFACDCNCRKGQPGMLLQAAQDLNIDLSASFMIGDKVSDLEAGNRAGCQSILVKSGAVTLLSDEIADYCPTVFNGLDEAAQYILTLEA